MPPWFWPAMSGACVATVILIVLAKGVLKLIVSWIFNAL
jgi:hypothetical protein